MKKKCFFLDRDGVINKEAGYITKINNLKIYKSSIKAIRLMKANNYLVIIITNQSAVGRGLISENMLKNIHTYLKKFLKKNKAYINDIFYCPYHEKLGKGKYKRKSLDRKPNPGMILKAIKKWDIDRKKSIMIGDRLKDKKAAQRAKVNQFYMKTKKIDLFKLTRKIIRNELKDKFVEVF